MRVEEALQIALQYEQAGEIQQAEQIYRQILQVVPNHPEALHSLGLLAHQLGRHDLAIEYIGRAATIDGRRADFHNNLGSALADRGDLDAAIACYQRALDLRPDYAKAHSGLLCLLQYRAGATLAELHAAHAEFERRHGVPLRRAWQPHDNSRDPGRPLRLGFVSADFGRHPVGYFLVRVLENLDRRDCEVLCYCDRIATDDMTTRLQAASAIWRDTSRMTDDRLAEQIRADSVDESGRAPSMPPPTRGPITRVRWQAVRSRSDESSAPGVARLGPSAIGPRRPLRRHKATPLVARLSI